LEDGPPSHKLRRTTFAVEIGLPTGGPAHRPLATIYDLIKRDYLQGSGAAREDLTCEN
jgi:hypothetical protein